MTNALGEAVELRAYLEKGPVILTWYRGGWCPYCNLTLHQLQVELPNFKANRATLIALTPELPDKSLSTSEKHDLEFEVLSDVGNKIAREYGIVFELNEDVAGYYNTAFDMESYNGDTSNELPLAATYVINDDDGRIRRNVHFDLGLSSKEARASSWASLTSRLQMPWLVQPRSPMANGIAWFCRMKGARPMCM